MKCVGDLESIVSLESVAMKYSTNYEEVIFEIIDRLVRTKLTFAA